MENSWSSAQAFDRDSPVSPDRKVDVLTTIGSCSECCTVGKKGQMAIISPSIQIYEHRKILHSPSSHRSQCSDGHASWSNVVPGHQNAFGTQRRPCGLGILNASRTNDSKVSKKENRMSRQKWPLHLKNRQQHVKFLEMIDR